MTAGPTDVRRALTERAQTLVPGWPVQVTVGEIDDETGPLVRVEYHVSLVVGPDSDPAREKLDGLLAPGGIKARLENDPVLAGLVCDLSVKSCSGYQRRAGPDGEQQLGATWIVDTLNTQE
jgi:hypothetical protein